MTTNSWPAVNQGIDSLEECMAIEGCLLWQLNSHRRGKKLLYRARAKITADFTSRKRPDSKSHDKTSARRTAARRSGSNACMSSKASIS